jgi:hypothetical protein
VNNDHKDEEGRTLMVDGGVGFSNEKVVLIIFWGFDMPMSTSVTRRSWPARSMPSSRSCPNISGDSSLWSPSTAQITLNTHPTMEVLLSGRSTHSWHQPHKRSLWMGCTLLHPPEAVGANQVPTRSLQRKATSTIQLSGLTISRLAGYLATFVSSTCLAH